MVCIFFVVVEATVGGFVVCLSGGDDTEGVDCVGLLVVVGGFLVGSLPSPY